MILVILMYLNLNVILLHCMKVKQNIYTYKNFKIEYKKHISEIRPKKFKICHKYFKK